MRLWALVPGNAIVHPESEWSWIDEEGRTRCLRFNKVRQSMCDALLDENDECPHQGEHGWSDGSQE